MLLRLMFFIVLGFCGWTAHSLTYQTGACDTSSGLASDPYWDEELIQMNSAVCIFVRDHIEGRHPNRGLSMAYDLANQGNISANMFIAQHLESGGFDSYEAPNLDKSLFYYQQALDLIELNPGHAPDRNYRYELSAHIQISILYFHKYFFGIKGDYNHKLLESAGYKGSRDLKTYPEYRAVTLESLGKAVEFSESCLSLPYKPYVHPEFYNGIQELCNRYKNFGESLILLEEQRLEEISQSSCKDIQNLDCKAEWISLDIMVLANNTESEVTSIYTTIMHSITFIQE